MEKVDLFKNHKERQQEEKIQKKKAFLDSLFKDGGEITRALSDRMVEVAVLKLGGRV